MNYSMLVQNRKSVREFSGKKVSASVTAGIKTYYENVQRLIPGIKTELLIFGKDRQTALEGAAGYSDTLNGAPQYLVLLSEDAPNAGINAGYIMEDLILKLTELGLGTCWITFTDSAAVKEALGITSQLEVAAIAAFGYGERTTKRLRLNILSMSNVDISAKRHYFDPKRSVSDMVYLGSWGNSEGIDEFIGFYDDMLWEGFYAASLSPSYLNRQPYGFIIDGNKVALVKRPDEFTTEIDGNLGLGVVLLHFSAVVSRWHSALKWEFTPDAPAPAEGCSVVAVCEL